MANKKQPRILVLEIEPSRYGFLGKIRDPKIKKDNVVWYDTKPTRDRVVQEAYAWIEISNESGFGPLILNELL